MANFFIFTMISAFKGNVILQEFSPLSLSSKSTYSRTHLSINTILMKEK